MSHRPPKLLVLQSVWALDGVEGFDIWHDLDRALDRVVQAGFDGVGVNLARAERTAGVARAMNAQGRAWEGQVLVRDAADLARWIATAAELGAHHLNVQVAGPVARVADALTLIDTLLPLAHSAPLPVWFETHRGRLTNDLSFTGRLIAARPNLKLTGDLSHYPVAGEFELPLRPDHAAAIEVILARCGNLHGRVSTGHQVQVPFDAPQYRDWRDQHIAWWRRAFELWLARARPGEAMTFMCELGPPPYAITDRDGRELSNRWEEAQRLRDLVLALWREVAGG